MPTIRSAAVRLTVALIFAAVLLSGCGGEQRAATAERASAPAPTWVALIDCSISFHRFAAGYLDEFTALAREAARRRVVLRYGCVAGSALDDGPLEADDYSDGGPIARTTGGDDALREQLGDARAIGSRRRMADRIGPRGTRGSDPFGAIERATENPRLQRIVLWSDFEVVDGGDDLRQATAADVDRIVQRWRGKLGHGLRGVTVIAVAIGRGAGDDETVRVARRLAHAIVTGAGGRFLAGDSLASATEVEG